MAINVRPLRTPIGAEDIAGDLHAVGKELQWAARALRDAESALGSCDWQELPCKLESLREALSVALAVIDSAAPEALAIAHRTSGDW